MFSVVLVLVADEMNLKVSITFHRNRLQSGTFATVAKKHLDASCVLGFCAVARLQPAALSIQEVG